MSEPKWTKPQQSAINARNSNILISAAAGSGKTAVLVERVIRLLFDPHIDVNIDELLIVTFTNAAAAEMRDRISLALNRIISEFPEHTKAHRQLSLLPSAKICTIDSFCINLVRENFFNLDIAQDFSILDSSQLSLIEQSAAEEILEKHYEENSVDFKKLVELLCTPKSDAELVNTIKKVDNYITSQPFPIDWLRETAELYNPDIPFEETSLYSYLIKSIKSSLDDYMSIIVTCENELSKDDEMFDKLFAMLDDDKHIGEYLKKCLDKSWDAFKNALSDVSFTRFPSAKKGCISLAKDTIKANRELYKSIVKDEISPLVCANKEEIKKDNEYLYPALKTLIGLVEEYRSLTFEMKKELNAYSFSDVEHFAITLLFHRDERGSFVRTPLADEYENRFYEILVDEYQDTNAAQDALFEMLSNGRNRFMVGDVKQSIYRFRLAMPWLFNAKKDAYTPYSEDSESVNQKIILDMNFRSNADICKYTNFLFSHLMSRAVGELEYNEEEYLYNGTKYPEYSKPCIQMNILETPSDEDTDEYEARHIAKTIISKVTSREQVKDGDSTRDIRYSDFAVLLRSAKNTMPVFSKVFSEYGIPVIAGNKTNLFENNEVVILLSLLRTVDNPTNDIPLLATLMSVFYGYTADDIAGAKVNFRAKNLYSSIARDDTFSVFNSDLEKYRHYASSMSTESFIRQIISETSYFSLISAMGNEEQRKLNVLKLIELAKRFDSGENVGLTSFIRFIDRLAEEDISVESADVSAFGEDCVSLMSVHKSKGLEFPVVILAGTKHLYNNRDLNDLVLFNNEYGIGLKVNNEDKLYRYNSIQYSTIKNINSTASMSENLRVLYVAVTRAKEQFISFISCKNVESTIKRLSSKTVNGKIPPFVVKNMNCDGDLLLLCALLHKDSHSLRKMTESAISVDESTDFSLEVNILSEIEGIEETPITEAEADNELVKQIEEKLSFVYNRASLSGYTAKLTASSLDEAEQSYQFFAKKKPVFLQGEKLTGAQKGTAMHAFMQYCRYEAARDNLEDEITRLKDNGFISELQAQALNRDKLSELFSSDFARRLFSSDRVYRELKVEAFVPINELEDTVFDDPVLIQGIADCVFEEDGKLVLVDYKTDYVKDENELLALYKKQVAFYKRAVEKVLQKPVKETMLYSFSLSKPCIYK